MSQTATIVVEDISEKSGTNKNGKAYTKWALKDGNGDWYSTFERGVVLDSMKGQKVDIEWEPNGNFKNLLKASTHEDSPIAARQDDGSADWDLIGLRKTRCALWVSALSSPATAAAVERWLSIQSTDVGTADILRFVEGFGKKLVLAAEMDIFQREPAMPEEDIPF